VLGPNHKTEAGRHLRCAGVGCLAGHEGAHARSFAAAFDADLDGFSAALKTGLPLRYQDTCIAVTIELQAQRLTLP